MKPSTKLFTLPLHDSSLRTRVLGGEVRDEEGRKEEGSCLFANFSSRPSLLHSLFRPPNSLSSPFIPDEDDGSSPLLPSHLMYTLIHIQMIG